MSTSKKQTEITPLKMEAADPASPPLAAYFEKLPPGPVADTKSAESLLAAHWGVLHLDQSGAMCGSKIRGRSENLTWDPPLVKFTIERHAGWINGSSRMQLQHWTIDVRKSTGSLKIGVRQVLPLSKKLDVKVLADAVVEEIQARRPGNTLKWHPDGRVKVLVGEIVTAGDKQTLTDRRRRFRKALIAKMREHGWKEISLHTYKQTSDS